MEKQIKAYTLFARKRLEALQAVREQTAEDKTAFRAQLDDFAAQHERRLRDFQHERLVHLLITLFFGVLFIVFCLLSLLTVSLNPLDFGTAQTICVLFLTLVLLIVEIFYVRHYFFLENSVQALYLVWDKLYALREDDSGQN